MSYYGGITRINYIMKIYIEKRAVETAQYIIDNKITVRDAAKIFCISKSTVHKDITERLLEIDKELCDKVKEVLQINLDERHIRGGLATRKKYSET